MLNFLQKPYPFDNNLRKNLTITFSISIFVFLFLLFFQPFGLKTLPEDLKIWIFLGFGFVTLFSIVLVIFIVPKIFPKIFIEEKWTILKEILFIQANVLTITFGNYFYSYFLGFHEFTLNDFISNFIDTFAVGIFPVSFIVVFNYIAKLKRNLKESKMLNIELTKKNSDYIKEQSETILLSSESGNENIELDLKNLLFIESTSNYIVVKYEIENKLQEKILRSSLTRIEESLSEFEQVFRCHRTYLVNIQNIKSITGNSQGYKLIFAGSVEIPVARSKSKLLKTLLKK